MGLLVAGHAASSILLVLCRARPALHSILGLSVARPAAGSIQGQTNYVEFFLCTVQPGPSFWP